MYMIGNQIQPSSRCFVDHDWENMKTLKVEERKFDGKVLEVLEIQLQDTLPHNENDLY